MYCDVSHFKYLTYGYLDMLAIIVTGHTGTKIEVLLEKVKYCNVSGINIGTDAFYG